MSSLTLARGTACYLSEAFTAFAVVVATLAVLAYSAPHSAPPRHASVSQQVSNWEACYAWGHGIGFARRDTYYREHAPPPTCISEDDREAFFTGAFLGSWTAHWVTTGVPR